MTSKSRWRTSGKSWLRKTNSLYRPGERERETTFIISVVMLFLQECFQVNGSQACPGAERGMDPPTSANETSRTCSPVLFFQLRQAVRPAGDLHAMEERLEDKEAVRISLSLSLLFSPPSLLHLVAVFFTSAKFTFLTQQCLCQQLLSKPSLCLYTHSHVMLT